MPFMTNGKLCRCCGKVVCGFHVWNNFQLLPAVENIRKSNKLEGGL